MSHLRPEEKPRHRISACRRGRHDFGESQHIGGGIERQVCEVCGSVTIDLTNGEPLRAPILHRRRQYVGSKDE